MTTTTATAVATDRHVWRFFRAGGFDQVRLDRGSDLAHLDQLDQKLWVALACPVGGLEFDERTADHKGASFGSVQVRLTGFVAPSSDSRGFRIARYQIACCAADAVASVVRITGSSGSKPARDQWVTVTGTFSPAADGVPELRAVSLAEIPTPVDPYE